MAAVASILTLILWVLSLAIFGRAIMSWFSPRGKDPITQILVMLTEPVLAPIRRVMPRTGAFDFTPMVALVVINFLLIPLVQRL